MDNIANGFISHGDSCEGCRHLILLAIGPDFKSGIELDVTRDLTDISATIAELLEFDFPSSEGLVMEELFK